MKYEYWFANIKGIKNARKQQIRQGMKTMEMLYYIEETEIKRMDFTEKERRAILHSIRHWKLEEEYQKMQEKGVRLVSVAHYDYPKRLLELSAPPYALYLKGKLPKENRMSVAIVGARECSCYGERMAKEFAHKLAEQGIQIVSGMARGIDSIGQRAALEAGGESFAVLGCGVDICYPKSEWNLYSELQTRGGIISEFPPGVEPLAQHFPARNRIIGGLADVLLVIEAKERSGSLITADMALEQGKEVFALPGPVDSCLSRGCNELIRQGAGILLTPEELLEELGVMVYKQKQKYEEEKILLETKENIVYSCLGFYPQNIEGLVSKTKLSVTEVINVLMSLELRGVVREISKNYYVRTK